ncbi:hypothetical protein V1515DRAFT_608943 [Lipomyces mesembrius]
MFFHYDWDGMHWSRQAKQSCAASMKPTIIPLILIVYIPSMAVMSYHPDEKCDSYTFNSSLFICAIFVVIAGAMPSYISFAAMVAIYGAGSESGSSATLHLEAVFISASSRKKNSWKDPD